MTERDNVIDLNQRRREHWIARLEQARKLGEVVVFNTMTETDGVVLQFPQRNRGES